MARQLNEKQTRAVRARYDRIAPLYDLMEVIAEPRYKAWRAQAWSRVYGPQVLEVGVGTGKNFPFHLPGLSITGIDFSERMLAKARARKLDHPVTLMHMDAQALHFQDNSFDSAIATFVFCSVPDPVLGLQEMARVVKPGQRIVLLEHMRAVHPIVGPIMDAIDPLVASLMGPHINRRTVDNVRKAGLHLESAENLGAGGIFKLIIARVEGKSPALPSRFL